MAGPQQLLEQIERNIVDHGGDLGGATRLSADGTTLQLFDGRITLRAEVDLDPGQAHAHVFAALDTHDEVLDACVMGLGEDPGQAVAQAALIWTIAVAGPIRSFLDARPVCQTIQTATAEGTVAEGFTPEDLGLPGVRAYVGPPVSRFADDDTAMPDHHAPWFRFAVESAAARRVHLAKVTILARGEEGWRRDLEVDGHDVSHHDPDWPAGVPTPDLALTTRYAVFEFPPDSPTLAKRAELDRTIWRFANELVTAGDGDAAVQAMVEDGFDPDLVDEVESMAPMAFGRMFFAETGVSFAPTIIRARRDGSVEPEVQLASIPAFNRALALTPRLYEEMSESDFELICAYSADSNAILQIMAAGHDLSGSRLYPNVVPDRGAPDATVDQAMAELQRLVDAGQGASTAEAKTERRGLFGRLRRR